MLSSEQKITLFISIYCCLIMCPILQAYLRKLSYRTFNLLSIIYNCLPACLPSCLSICPIYFIYTSPFLLKLKAYMRVCMRVSTTSGQEISPMRTSVEDHPPRFLLGHHTTPVSLIQ